MALGVLEGEASVAVGGDLHLVINNIYFIMADQSLHMMLSGYPNIVGITRACTQHRSLGSSSFH